jgi:hypothetical protein
MVVAAVAAAAVAGGGFLDVVADQGHRQSIRKVVVVIRYGTVDKRPYVPEITCDTDYATTVLF